MHFPYTIVEKKKIQVYTTPFRRRAFSELKRRGNMREMLFTYGWEVVVVAYTEWFSCEVHIAHMEKFYTKMCQLSVHFCLLFEAIYPIVSSQSGIALQSWWVYHIHIYVQRFTIIYIYNQPVLHCGLNSYRAELIVYFWIESFGMSCQSARLFQNYEKIKTENECVSAEILCASSCASNTYCITI